VQARNLRWLRRCDRAQAKRRWRGMSADLEAEFRRSEQSVWAYTAVILIYSIGMLVHAWLLGRGEDQGRLAEGMDLVAISAAYIPALFMSDDRWIRAMIVRSRGPQGVGLEWLARQRSIRRWRRVGSTALLVLGVFYAATIPVTHAIDRTPDMFRKQIEYSAESAELLLYAIFLAVVLRRFNRRCFETVRVDLIAAEQSSAESSVVPA
jgi:hypothetical protein